MAINKKLIHFKSKTNFLNEYNNGNILPTSIVFILDAKQIYTHGQLYNCPFTEDEIRSLLNNKADLSKLNDYLTKTDAAAIYLPKGNYITSIPTANGTTAGIVKQGGDVTISNGVITVNDDSHNHIISNVDGLQSALDAKQDIISDLSTIRSNASKGATALLSVPLASTTSLGGVKSGGDVTISSEGIMSVVDDSHNHIISNVDGLLSALDAKLGIISDLSTIRSGAALGATALQSVPAATTSTAGIVKVGSNISVSSGTISLSKANVTAALGYTPPTAYTNMTASEATTGTSTTGRVISAKVLHDKINEMLPTTLSEANSYTDTKVSELVGLAPEALNTIYELAEAMATNLGAVDTLESAIGNKVDKVSGKGLSTNDYTTTEKNKLAGIASGAEVNVQSDWSVTDTTSDAYIKNKPSLSAVATSGSYSDLSGRPTVDSTISTSSTNAVQNKAITAAVNAKYTKPSTGIPSSDLSSDILGSLAKADSALQSFTETDPVFTASAAASIKSSDISNWNSKTSNVGTITGIKMNGESKGTSGVVDLGTVITAHQDISGKVDKVSGKGLSTNDYTTTEKSKLAGIAAGANKYSLPLAASGTRGGIQLGYSASGANVPVAVSSEKAYVALTKTAVTSALGYTPPTSNTTYSIATNGTSGLVKPWYNHTAASTGPTAGSDSTAVTVNSISTTSGRYYALEMDSNGRGFVNVPWSNTTYTSLKNPNSLTVQYNGTTSYSYDGSAAKTLNIKAGSNITVSGDSSGNITINGTPNTTYSAGKGLSLSGTTFSVNYGTTAGTACQGNDSRLSNSRPASDVYSWAKASTKPSYTYSEVGAAASSHSHSQITVTACNSSSNSKAWNKVNVDAQKLKVWDVYSDGGPVTYGNILEINGISDHWKPQLWFDGGTGQMRVRNRNYKSTSWGAWRLVLDDTNYSSYCAPASHTHSYAGASSAGGSATSAVKLDTATAGSATQPVYFSGGKPVACTYTLGKSVPSNAVFTDTNTHYTTRIYAGASGTAANAAATSPYIKITDDNTYRNQIRLVGGGATTVTSDANGNITISSTDNNTWRPLGTTADTACAGNDSRLSNSRPASDVYSWAKQSTKPSYSWSEIGSKPSFATVATSGKYSDLSGKPTIPTNTNQLTNGAGFITRITNSMVTTALGYTTASTVASLNVDYRTIYVTLNANASLSASAVGATYNGRSITAYVYTSAARTITIPTSGNYVSMCGSSYTTTAGKWVEFNLVCVNGVWHIAKLEQE